MKEQTLLIQFLGNNPTLRIIDFFLDNRTDYSKKEIIEALGMSKTTFYKVETTGKIQSSFTDKEIWKGTTI